MLPSWLRKNYIYKNYNNQLIYKSLPSIRLVFKMPVNIKRRETNRLLCKQNTE